MGFEGHNRGKKWVPGVGYVAPPTKPKKPRPPSKCHGCGSPNVRYAVVISVRPMKTAAYCEKCFDETDLLPAL